MESPFLLVSVGFFLVWLVLSSYSKRFYNSLNFLMAKSAAISKGTSGQRQYLKVFSVPS